MTDIGESIAPPSIDLDLDSCPFDHDEPTPPDVRNELIGVGSKLATQMKNGTGTHLYAKVKAHFKPEPIQNPKDRPGHPFEKKGGVKNRCVIIEDVDGNKIYAHTYPVTCAAHHIIPAQEALKDSPLLAFMCKKGTTEKLKDKDYSDGVVWSAVGYDVNGCENGIFLPGSYAVGGGRGGEGVWADNSDEDEDRPEDASDSTPDPSSNELTGALYGISETNRKWRYVRQAMHLAPGQFHDRHVAFSNFVKGVLDKLFENYVRLLLKMQVDSGCPQCKKRADDIETLGFPTPYGLVQRLNGCASNLKVFLDGRTWRRNIYTSGWGNSFMEGVVTKNPAARLNEQAESS